jgi:hypothetical protein
MAHTMLSEWENFYVIVGSAAAGLTGLTFVVITLAADANRASAIGLRTFVTPTIVHFGVVLALAAFLSVPNQNVTSLSWGLGVIGAAGFIYLVFIGANMSGIRKKYVPVREDWVWNVVLPAVAYAQLIAAALFTFHRLQLSLYLVAAVATLLLFVGIHNAWDVAVWNSTRRQDD